MGKQWSTLEGHFHMLASLEITSTSNNVAHLFLVKSTGCKVKMETSEYDFSET